MSASHSDGPRRTELISLRARMQARHIQDQFGGLEIIEIYSRDRQAKSCVLAFPFEQVG